MMIQQTKKSTAPKIFLLVLVTLLVVLFALPLAACGSSDNDNTTEKEKPIPDGKVRITINYLRPDADYDEWNLWLWLIGAEGAAYQFKKGTVSMSGYQWKTFSTDVTVDSAEDQIAGFIVRKGEWSAKDPDLDRFITKDMIVDNRVTIYVVKAREDIFMDSQTAVDAATSNTLVAAFTNFKTISISAGTKITGASHFKVYDNADTLIGEMNCATTTTYVNKNYATIKLDQEVDITKTYRIVDDPAAGFNKLVNFAARNVYMGSLFNNKQFNDNYKYDGELGVEYTPAKSTFRVWSPMATAVKLNIYEAGEGGTAQTVDMTKGEKGVWSVEQSGDLNGKYYTYSATAQGVTKEVVDPYAKSAGRDGKRGMILDLASTNPDGWDEQNIPTLNSYSEAVIYEAHLRDLTIHESSGVSAANRGKFLGLTEEGTTVTVGSVTKSTGLDYLKELGVTAVHFQPLFDFASVKEDFNVATYNKDGEFNWGYDPLNYNVPEGSYSSDPADGTKRVNEMKQMVMALHNAGIQVVMDVVYNHVSSAQSSNFEALMPGYYFRTRSDGTFYNGSGCGNETASERAMFRKFMIDSVKYWATEYKIDGFRFDLMGLHDITTMNQIYTELKAINPSILIYGEGWTGGASGLSENDAALQKNAAQTPGIAYFNDIVRDGLKGSVFDMADVGFATGAGDLDAAIYVGAVGATNALSSETYKTLGSDKKYFAGAPTQSINYVSAHDNSTLWDKINASVDEDEEILKAMYRLAAASVFSSQGPAFFLAGEEMLRSKPTTADNTYDNRATAYITNPEYYFSDNSYKSPDSVNAIDWTKRIENDDMVEYYKSLIEIKKNMAQFQFTTEDEIKEHIVFIDSDTADGVAVYGINYGGSFMVIAFNANDTAVEIDVPTANFIKAVDGDKINGEGLVDQDENPITVTDGKLTVGAYSLVVLRTSDEVEVDDWTYSVEVVEE